MRFIIEQIMYEYFPGMQFVAGLVENIQPVRHSDELRQQLTAAWEGAAQAAIEYGNPQSHPFIKPWGEGFKRAGISRKEHPVAIESLVRRAGKGGTPVFINPLVDFYNAVSLKHLIPAGGFDLDQLPPGAAIELGRTRSGDMFEALDGAGPVAVAADEIAYRSGREVLTRHFAWKQARLGLLGDNSRRMFLVAEVIGGLPPDTAQRVADDFAEGLEKYFGVAAALSIIDETMPLDVEL